MRPCLWLAIYEIVNVCTDPRENAIFGVDPTFNLGPFNVTVTTCSNLKVTDRASNAHQTIVGPLMLSQKKAFDSYNHFFRKIISLKKEPREILAFGTDGGKELFEAMRFNFPLAIHLRCFGHFKDD